MQLMQLSGIDLNLLVVFDALLETHSVKLAAGRLALSPSATSHALGRLRDLLDDPVLVRAGQRMVPTARAAALHPAVQDALGRVGAILSAGRPLEPATLQRSFRIGGNDFAEIEVLSRLSPRLEEIAPGVDVYSVPLSRDATAMLREGLVDLALGVFGPAPEDIRTEVLMDEHFVCLLRRGHPALRRKLTVERYAALGHLLVAPRGTPRDIVDELLERRGLRRRVARTVTTFAAAPGLLATSDYVLTVDRRVAVRYADSHDLVVREPPLEVPGYRIVMRWHRRTDEDPAQAWLREQVAEAVED